MASPRRRRGLEVAELPLGGQAFDPTEPGLRGRLLALLGVDGAAAVEAMTGFRGGLNKGIWFVKSKEEELVLKLVQGTASHPDLPTEAENLRRLQREHPGIASDPAVAFPFRIIRIHGGPGGAELDLVAMPRAPGRSLVDAIQEDWRAGRRAELLALLERVGSCVAGFHRRYGGKQHCDLQPGNILCDDRSGRVTLVDLGGMGSACVVGSDVEHFVESLEILGRTLGPELARDGCRHFRAGYARPAGPA
mmetsp:Transcript_79662/g.247411  ORF Transcript_79662/g.247411 Transcript_79662/m.247411 type:complete len:249 (+) Transcript_79662:2-748(+)